MDERATIIDLERRLAEAEAALRANIDMRKRAGEVLNVSEARYQLLLDSIDDGFCVIEVLFDEDDKPFDYRFLEVNSAFERQTGLVDPVGRTILSMVPTQEPFWFETYGRIVRTKRPEQFDHRADALGRWYEVDATPIGEPGQNQVAVVFRDVLERRRAEAALRESEERHTFLLHFSDAVRGLTDPAAVATTACRMLLDKMDVDRAHWAEIDRKTMEFVTVGSVHSPGVIPIEGRFPLAAWELYSATHREGRPVVVDDTQTDPRADSAMRAAAASMDIGADLAAPILVGGHLASVLAVKRRQPHRWTSQEIAFVESIAGRCWAEIDRARAEAALRDSNERFRTMADNAPVLIWETDQSGATSVNRHYTDFFGVGADDIAKMGWADFLHPDDAQGYIDAYAEAFRQRTAYAYECRFRRADGQWRWLRNSGGPVAQNRFVGCSLDVTDLLNAQRAMRESEKRQTFLLKLSDTVGSLAGAADIQAETTRLLREQLKAAWCYYVDWDLDRNIGLVLRDSASEGLPSLAGAHDMSDAAEFLQLLAVGAVLTVRDYASYEQLSTRIRQKFTALGFRSMVVAPLVKEGRLIASLLVGDTKVRDWSASETSLLVDVAERTWAAVERARAEVRLRESEERFQQFATASAAGLWIRDAGTLVMEYVSPAIGAIYGVQADALLGDVKRWASTIVPEDRDIALSHLETARNGEVAIHEFRIQRPSDGAFRWIRNTDFPLRDDGHIPRIGGIAEDATEAKLAAEHTGVLLAELQHRVRNIMAIIRAIASRSAEHAGTVPEYAEILAGRLLAFSRIQALLTRGANVSVGLRTIIVDEVSVQAQHEGQYDIEGPDIEISPKAAEVLTLAFHELSTNALKYGALSVPDGKVTVRWEIMEKRGTRWLSLDWTERGAPERPEPRSAEPRREGFGSELIEGRIPYELNGRGRLVITPEGAQCHFEFPLTHGASVLETGAPRRATVFGGVLDMTGEPDLKSGCILVVEDDYYQATDMARALRGAGAEVVGPCGNEAAAREELAEKRPDAVLLDINLGPGPTFKIAEMLKDRGIPFAFITGYDQGVIPAEFDGIERLEKPVQPRQIVKAAAKLLSASA